MFENWLNVFTILWNRTQALLRVGDMHATDLAPMRKTLFEYLSGAFGGPPLYMRRADAKCIMSARARFAIGTSEIDQWMMCMRGALEEAEFSGATWSLFEEGFQRMADAMRNQ